MAENDRGGGGGIFWGNEWIWIIIIIVVVILIFPSIFGGWGYGGGANCYKD